MKFMRLVLPIAIVFTMAGCPLLWATCANGVISDDKEAVPAPATPAAPVTPTYHPGHCQNTVVPCPDGRGSACCPACGGVCF